MQCSSATWSFVRKQAPPASRGPIGLDALHALQHWRARGGGRAFRVLRGSPFVLVDEFHARLEHLHQDERADSDLAVVCDQFRIGLGRIR